MVNRINIGEISPPTTFRYTGATPITADQYKNSFVDYFNQHIGGSASLEEQTVIDVDTPEIAGVPISYEEKQDDDSTSVLASAFRPENIANFTFGEEAMNSFDNLKRPTIVEDRTELFDDFKDLFRNATENGIVQTLEGAAPYAIKTIASAMNPLLGIGVSALTGGEGTNLLANEARKVQADKIDAVRAAMSRGDADAGFVMTFNRLNIVRGPGENFYTGNRQGISFKQLKNLEAVQKGFLPETFRFDRSKDGQDGFFLRGQPINQTIDGSGGIRISDNPLDGFYKANGTFYSPRFGYSKVGMMSHIAKLSATTGLSDTRILEVLSIARSGRGNFGDMIRDLTTPVRTTVDVQQRDLTEKEKQNIAKRQLKTFLETEKRAKDVGLDKKDKDGKNIAAQFAKRAVDYETGNMSDEDIADDLGFNTGGFVQRLAPGGGVRMADSASGFVDGVPPSQATDAQEVADDKEGKLPEGAFVINASAVTFAGETDIINMLRQAQEEAVRRGITADNPKASSMIDVAVSRGEVVVAPYLVNIIGKDRLEKINNRGVKDTERKIEENGQQVQGAAKGKLINVYRGEPLDPDEVSFTVDYGYGKEDVGKFHTPDINRARSYANTPFIEKGNRVIKSRKVTVDELFEGVKEAWRTHAKQNTDYFARMPKSELKKNMDFVDTLKEEIKSGKGRSINDIAIFLQEQVFSDDKSKINFIETFKNDPKTAFKLAGRAMTKIATKATPPIAILEMAAGILTPTAVADATLQGNESFLTR